MDEFIEMWKIRGDRVRGMKTRMKGWNQYKVLNHICNLSTVNMKKGILRMKRDQEKVKLLDKEKYNILKFLILFTETAIARKRTLMLA